MPVTPRNLAGHELVGLPVKVVSSTDPGLVGLEGTVVWETERLLVVERVDGKEAREIRVPKKGTVFRFSLASVDGKKQKKTKVNVEGWIIMAKPEERTKRLQRVLSVWRARAEK
jgi:RNase P/RNase MRP subunit p29